MKSIIFNQHQVNHALKNEEGMFRVVVKPCSVHPKSLCKKEKGVHIGIEFMKDGFFWRPVGGCELQPFPYYNGELSKDRSFADYAKFKVGETIFVKEKFKRRMEGFYYAEDEIHFRKEYLRYSPYQSPVHMKQEHSRLTLRIKSVKVERLQDISEEDAVKEGATSRPNCHGYGKKYDGWSMDWSRVGQPSKYTLSGTGKLTESDVAMGCAKYAFANHWNSTHKKSEEKWEASPWVFAYEYEVVR